MRTDIRACRTQEKLFMLARKEVEIARMKPKCFINKELILHFPQRSLEAIKGARKKVEYREAVAKFMQEIQTASSSSPVEGAGVTVSMEPGNSLTDNIVEFLMRLPPVTPSKRYKSDVLDNLVKEATSVGKASTIIDLDFYLKDVLRYRERPVDKKPMENRPTPTYKNRRQKRRADFGRIQKMWKKDQSR